MTSVNGTTNTSNTAATTGASGTTGKTSTSSAEFGSGMGKDTFLKLLVAQLKYQNPLQPTDGQEYMAQMAQFTTVEKLADIQKSQTDLVSWQRAVAGQGMIGKTVTATPASTGTEISGTVTGLKFTDAGPRLVLSSGQTVAVDEVTSVGATAGPATTSSATTSSGTSGTSTAGTGTSGTGTSGTSTSGTGTSGTSTSGTGTSSSATSDTPGSGTTV